MGIDINIRIAGGAGQGVHTAGGLISRMAVAAGHHFLSAVLKEPLFFLIGDKHELARLAIKPLAH
jgi:hypothetical protein